VRLMVDKISNPSGPRAARRLSAKRWGALTKQHQNLPFDAEIDMRTDIGADTGADTGAGAGADTGAGAGADTDINADANDEVNTKVNGNMNHTPEAKSKDDNSHHINKNTIPEDADYGFDIIITDEPSDMIPQTKAK
jgi:hypothetical protein